MIEANYDLGVVKFKGPLDVVMTELSCIVKAAENMLIEEQGISSKEAQNKLDLAYERGLGRTDTFDRLVKEAASDVVTSAISKMQGVSKDELKLAIHTITDLAVDEEFKEDK